jgi:hypothetical protein
MRPNVVDKGLVKQTTVSLSRYFRSSGNPVFFQMRLALGLLPRLVQITARSLSGLTLFLLFAAPTAIHGQGLAAAEKQKIEALINHVGALGDAKFIRNGAVYEVATAVRFLRGKWDTKKAVVKTAGDFIDKVATKSDTSGKPYMIRFKDGKEISSQEYLSAELKKLEGAS